MTPLPHDPVVARSPEMVRVAEALAAPFDPKDVKFKPQLVKNNRALAMAYVDARVIQDRLDEVLGVENWQDRYEFLPDGSVVCHLKLKLGGKWITKSDVGSPSDQPDSGDRTKAAVSDALKRAAVKFGIGRYLYRLPSQWVEYDPVKKQIVRPPQLPAFALPATVRDRAARPATSGTAETTASVATTAPAPPTPPPAGRLPASGQELLDRLRGYEAKLVERKVCVPGALVEYVRQAGVRSGFPSEMSEWSGPAIAFAVETVRRFEQSARQASSSPLPTAA